MGAVGSADSVGQGLIFWGDGANFRCRIVGAVYSR